MELDFWASAAARVWLALGCAIFGILLNFLVRSRAWRCVSGWMKGKGLLLEVGRWGWYHEPEDEEREKLERGY